MHSPQPGLTLLLAAVLMSAGCQLAPSGVVPTVPAPSLTTEEQEAQRFRQELGLRSDLLWIRLVAADPSSNPGKEQYGIPLTPAEKGDLDSRAARFHEVAPAIEAYAAGYPDEWGGLWIDQSKGGVVVAQFTARLQEHGDALRTQLPLGARFELRQVNWPLTTLNALKERITAELQADDGAWYRTIGAELLSNGVSISDNAVALGVSSANPAAPRLIQEHFGALDGQLTVQSDGKGPGPRPPLGTLIIIVTDAAGRPVDTLTCLLKVIGDVRVPEPPELYTDQGGRCRTQTWAIEYDIDLRDDRLRVVGRGYVKVVAGDVTIVRITVR